MDSIIARFLNVAERHPNASALSWRTVTWNYTKLARRAGAVQAALRAAGIGRGDRVGIGLSRGPDMVAALLGSLAAGATYVPLDPSYPKGRLRLMAEDAGCARVFHDGQDEVAWLDAGQALRVPREDATLTAALPADIAYIIYTSGSTGSPKGVAVRQSSVLALLEWAKTHWSAAELSCVFAGTSISFDISVFELFAPLTTGAEVMLASNVLELIDHPQRERVTLVNTVPSAVVQMLRVKPLPNSVLAVCIAGESFPGSLADALVRPGRRIFNLYGPTEDTVFSTVHEVTAGGPSVPIGRPIPGTRAHVLDAEGRPAAVGEEAELYLAGAGVAAGYVGKPELTRARFVPDPDESGARMYRTGDIVTIDEHGLMHYRGRCDQQVKLRGFRIELDEIRVALEAQPGVFEAVVLLVPGPNDDPRLLAWVCPRALHEGQLRERLAGSLPSHMLPAAIMPIACIPRLPNGKLDRAGLPLPANARVVSQPPTTELERMVAALFAEVLGLDAIGRDENFTELGGTSLTAVAVLARMRETLGKTIGLADFFACPCVAEVAAAVEASVETELPVLTRAVDRDLPTPAQEQMWVIEQLQPGRLDYLTAVVVELECDASVADVVEAVMAVVRRHPSLHSITGPDLRIRPSTDCVPPIQILEPSEDPRAAVEDAVRRDASRAIRVDTELPLRLIVGADANRRRVLGFIVHHIAFDGWSLGVLVSDLTQTLAAQIGSAPPLPPLEIDTRDYAAWLRRPEVVAKLEYQCHARVEALAGAPTLLRWPTPTQARANGRRSLACPPTLLAGVARVARTLGTTPFVVELAAFTEIVARYLNVDELIVGTAAVVRRHPALEDAIAYLSNLVPCRIRRRPSLAFACAQAHAEVYRALDCAEVPFARLVDAARVERTADRNPLVQVAFGVEAPAPQSVFGPVRGHGEQLYLGHTRLDLTAWLRPSADPGAGSIAWTWRGDVLDCETVGSLHDGWIRALELGIADPNASWASSRRFVGRVARRPITTKLVEDGPGPDGVSWIYRATSPGSSVQVYVARERASLLERYRERGAILLRGFQPGPASDLADLVDRLFRVRVRYSERSSPRSDVAAGVYTSTDHPADQPIALHNEQSYTLNWPLRILFRCDVPATRGGATPIADMRSVLRELDPELVRRFAELGVRYQRNYITGIGVSWRDAFQTDDRDAVAQYCRANHIEWEWVTADHLRTEQVRPALRRHPETDEQLFFNHALFFHISSLPVEVADGLRKALDARSFPTQTCWGDGREFEPDVLAEIRRALATHTVRFDWRAGDILILDNMRIAHGRDPFAGPRRVLVAMADPVCSLYGEPSAAANSTPTRGRLR